jgi:hypothetical protein
MDEQARRYHERAVHLRKIAAVTTNDSTRESLLQIVIEYELKVAAFDSVALPRRLIPICS